MHEITETERSLAQRLLGFADAVLQHGVDWVNDWRFAAEHRLYLDRIKASGELESMLEAVGLTPQQLKACEISPLAAAELMVRMMQRLGIATIDEHGNPLRFDNLSAHCQVCRDWRRCRRWLDHGAPGEAYREFCPNTEQFDRLRQLAAEAH